MHHGVRDIITDAHGATDSLVLVVAEHATPMLDDVVAATGGTVVVAGAGTSGLPGVAALIRRRAPGPVAATSTVPPRDDTVAEDETPTVVIPLAREPARTEDDQFVTAST